MHKLLTLGLASLFLVVTGCQDTNTTGPLDGPTGPLAGPSFHQGGDNGDDDDELLVLNVNVDEDSFTLVDVGDGVGPFNVEGDAGSGAGSFRCWGWILPDASGIVSQVYHIAGRGTIMTQGREGDFLAIVGGTGDFRNVQGEAIQVFTGNGFDFTVTFDFDDDFDDDDDDD